MKKIVTLFLLTLLPLVANAYDAKIDGIYYNFSGEEAIVTYQKYQNYTYTSDYSGAIVIPESVTYNGNTYSVTSIGKSAFYNCKSMKSVTIPNSVTSIGEYAFENCKGLTSITIPNSVTKIESGAFGGCSSLTSVIIPNSVTSIGSQAFQGCSSLTIVTIGNSVTSIGYRAFYSCSSLTSITIPKSVTKIEGDTFSYCDALTSIKVESGNTIYDSRNNCNAIIETATNTLITGCKNTIIPESVTSIRYDAFYGCSNLTSIVIPNNVTDIGGRAFEDCPSLTSITIPNSVRTIGRYAFKYCRSLNSIILNENMTDIGTGAFFGCYFVKNRFINNSTLTDEDNWGATLCDKETDDGLLIKDDTAVTCRNWATSITIPNGVISIKPGAFSSYSGLTSISISNSVTNIGESAFYECSGLTSVKIGSGVTNIGGYAFGYCPKLTNVYCYAENTPICGDDNFNFNTTFDGSFIEFATLHVPASSIDKYKTTAPWKYFGAIVPINNVSPNIIFADGNVKKLCVDNWDSNKDGELSEAEAAAVTELGDIFKDKSQIKSFKEFQYFKGLTDIGYRAFSGCSNLISIIIPESVRTISFDSFPNCNALTSISVEEGNTQYDSRNGCNAIIETATNTLIVGCQNTIIPNNVTDIGSSAFAGRWSMKKMTIPENVTSIGNWAFSDCTSLTSVIIPHMVTSIGEGAFNNCCALTSISIPTNVTRIDDNAFNKCTGLTSVSIGNSVTYIGNWVFYRCSSITDFYCHAENVPEIGSTAFNNSSSTSAILHVPASSINKYKAKAPWKNFKMIVALTDEDAIKGIKVENETDMGYYDLQGRKQDAPQKGINIIRYSDGTTRKVAIK